MNTFFAGIRTGRGLAWAGALSFGAVLGLSPAPGLGSQSAPDWRLDWTWELPEGGAPSGQTTLRLPGSLWRLDFPPEKAPLPTVLGEWIQAGPLQPQGWLTWLDAPPEGPALLEGGGAPWRVGGRRAELWGLSLGGRSARLWLRGRETGPAAGFLGQGGFGGLWAGGALEARWPQDAWGGPGSSPAWDQAPGDSLKLMQVLFSRADLGAPETARLSLGGAAGAQGGPAEAWSLWGAGSLEARGPLGAGQARLGAGLRWPWVLGSAAETGPGRFGSETGDFWAVWQGRLLESRFDTQAKVSWNRASGSLAALKLRAGPLVSEGLTASLAWEGRLSEHEDFTQGLQGRLAWRWSGGVLALQGRQADFGGSGPWSASAEAGLSWPGPPVLSLRGRLQLTREALKPDFWTFVLAVTLSPAPGWAASARLEGRPERDLAGPWLWDTWTSRLKGRWASSAQGQGLESSEVSDVEDFFFEEEAQLLLDPATDFGDEIPEV